MPKQELTCKLGERSPLARLYQRDARILLLGIGHERNSSLHLAEYRAEFPGKRLVQEAAPVSVRGRRRWIEFESLLVDSSDFTRLGGEYERETGAVQIGFVGHAQARLLSMKPLVDFAVRWLEKNRT